MFWFKIASIAVGVLVVFIVVSSVIGYLIEAIMAALVVAVIAFGVKAKFHNK